MPRLSAALITLTPEQEARLLGLARAHKTPRKLAERAEIILRSAAGTEVRAIARQLGVWPKTVRHWRSGWLSGQAEAAAAARLADEPRPGGRLSRPSRSAQSWLWPANHRKRASCRSVTGARAT